ncbi:MAG: signal peptidase I [Candidatus Pacebacteria bacterium]|nr:signal peptidase I [Candidatus Paceibacterota bacterium]
MTTIVFLVALLAVLIILLNGAVLLGVSRLFKAPITYGKSVYFSLLSGISAGVFAGGLNFFVGLNLTGSLIGLIVGFIVLWLLLKNYYSISFAKSLGIYVVNLIVGTVVGFIFALLFAVPIRTYVFEPVVVSGQSMSPHYNPGDYLFVAKWDKDFKRDEVIVYRTSTGSYIIQRVVGLPGEVVSITDGKLLINGKQYESKFLEGAFTPDLKVDLGSDQYFVLGDNLAHSADSRTKGPVGFDQIVGKVLSVGK